MDNLQFCAKNRKSGKRIKNRLRQSKGASRKNAFLLKKKTSTPTLNDPPNDKMTGNDVNSPSFHDLLPGDIIQLDGGKRVIECSIPLIENRYQCLQENPLGNTLSGSSGLLQTGLDTSRLPTEEDFKESLWNPWTVMETHNGRPKRGDSPGKGKGISSVSSSSTPLSSPKALFSTQSPQISITSPDKVSSEVVKEQSGNEGQRAAEGQKGPPSTVRNLCRCCLMKQEISPKTDRVIDYAFCAICQKYRKLFRHY